MTFPVTSHYSNTRQCDVDGKYDEYEDDHKRRNKAVNVRCAGQHDREADEDQTDQEDVNGIDSYDNCRERFVAHVDRHFFKFSVVCWLWLLLAIY